MKAKDLRKVSKKKGTQEEYDFIMQFMKIDAEKGNFEHAAGIGSIRQNLLSQALEVRLKEEGFHVYKKWVSGNIFSGDKYETIISWKSNY